MAASEKGHLDVVKTLIEAGANVNHTNKVGVYHVHCTLYYCLSSAGLYTYVCMYIIISCLHAMGTNIFMA